MKPLTFENLRRLIGGGRKKKDTSSFKRSDSFKRISIRKSYLDRGKKKVAPKLEASTQTVEEDIEVAKVDSSVQVGTSKKNSVKVYSRWLDEIKEPVSSRGMKGSERTIIYVPACPPPIRELSSSPPRRETRVRNSSPSPRRKGRASGTTSPTCTPLQRTQSSDSAVEMFPWGVGVKKSPLLRRRGMNLMKKDDGGEELCSLSISLGRIWMDVPQGMTPRSLELPKTSTSSNPPAHNSLDSALKDHASKKAPTRTLSSNSNSTGLFSSKDSGFSFGEMRETRGFFRKKTRPKPSVSREGYFKRISVEEEKREGSRRKKKKKKDKDMSTIRSDIYQVIHSRQRPLGALKLDPMIFVPPERRKTPSSKPAFKNKIQEIRNFNPLDSSMYLNTSRSLDSTDEGLYESLDYDYISDGELDLESFERGEEWRGYGVVRRFSKGVAETSKKPNRNNRYREPKPVFSDQDSLESVSSSDSEQNRVVYVPPGVSPVPKRKPVRRKLSRKKSITYLVKPTVIRAPSTLRRPQKKIGKRTKASKKDNLESSEDNAQDPCI